MSSVLDEMRTVLEGDELFHYGTKYHSGRYPYGSGEDPFQHEGDFLTRIDRLKKDGWEETAENVQKEFGMKLEEYRNEKYWAEYTRKNEQIARVHALKEKGYGVSAIGREIGESESTIRGWLKAEEQAKIDGTKSKEPKAIADFLKEKIDEKGMPIDVGKNNEIVLGVKRTTLDKALYALESEGYVIQQNRIPQPNNPGNYTTQMVLCPPGSPKNASFQWDKIATIEDYKFDENTSSVKKKFTYPESLDSSRLMVRYADDVGPDGFTGIQKDGTIELRRGVADLDLKGDRYSQVRILVDGTHYLKGMAVYSDDMPDGVDVVFNTNKKKGTPALGDKDNTVLKPIKKDPENPFGSTIKDADEGGQYWYNDPKTGEEHLGLINKKSSQGDWSEWADALPSQFLSKQSKQLAERQLNLAAKERYNEYDSICAIDNPTIKKHFLKSFADDCDGAAVNLKAASLPGQKYHVIIPINNQKDTEIYAPGYENGTKLALIRYPHGGTFEIPVLTVNNNNKLAKKVIGDDSIDAVGITSKVAEQLSGADFDGDTVMCIPTDYGNIRINRKQPLDGLKNFEPKDTYRTEKRGDDYYNIYGDKVKIMTQTDKEMGVISNLITDMTLSDGATEDELARAVRHSMVVIDAEKHKLDYKRSEVENGIAELKRKYQRTVQPDGSIKTGGASTIISKAKGTVLVPKTRGQARINKETGEQTYLLAEPKDRFYVDKTYNKKTGEVTLVTTDGKKIKYNSNNPDEVERYAPIATYHGKGENTTVTYSNKAGDISYNVKERTQKITNMANTKDAYTLVSEAQHPMELLYADYANSMKALANQARKEMVSTGTLKYNPSAAAVYKEEVDQLMASLNNAEKNSIRERQALRLTNADIMAKTAADEAAGIDTSSKSYKKDLKKTKQQSLTKNRELAGSVSRRDRNITITDRQWEAIQAGAIHESTLKRILANADADDLRQRATPRESRAVTTGQLNRMKSMQATGRYTIGEIANQLGLSTTTVKKYLEGVD